MHATIIEILNSHGRNAEKIAALEEAFQRIDTFSQSDFAIIDRAVKGPYSQEFMYNHDGFQRITAFYTLLLKKFPCLLEIQVALSDLHYLQGDEERAIDLYMDAIDRKPLLVFGAPGEFYLLMTESGKKNAIRYGIALVRALVLEESQEDALEELQRLHEEYADEPTFKSLLNDDFVKLDISNILSQLQ